MLSTGTNRTAASVLKRVGVGGGGGGGESSSERTLTEEAGMIAVKRLIYLLNFSLKNKVVMEVIGQNRFRTFLDTNQKPQRGIPYTLDQSRKINKRRGV